MKGVDGIPGQESKKFVKCANFLEESHNIAKNHPAASTVHIKYEIDGAWIWAQLRLHAWAVSVPQSEAGSDFICGDCLGIDFNNIF